MVESRIEFDMQSMTGFGKSASFAVKKPEGAGAKPTDQGFKKDLTGRPWSYWGDDNLFPQNAVALVSKSTVAPAALNFKIKSMYGRGLMTCNIEIGENGEEIVRPVKVPEVEEFFKANNIKRYLLETITDFYWFFNVFPEIILSKDRKKIVQLSSNEAAHSRWAVKDPKTRKIEKCYVSANWEEGTPTDLQEVKVLDMYSPLLDLQGRTDAWKYILPVNYPTPDKSYYQLAYWDGARSNGWIDVANDIPNFKKSMFKNQMSIKYHIRIPYDHWPKKYKDWEKKSEKEQQECITLELGRMNDWLTGTANAEKAFISHFATDKISGKEIPGWEILPLENKYKDGAWLPDSAAANSEILFSMQVDPSLMGAGTPGGLYQKNDGGSNKRESFLINTALLQTERDCIVEPLYLIKEYNGWPENLEFRFRDTILTTLDTGAGTKKVVS